MAECLDYSGNSIVPLLSHDFRQVAIGHDLEKQNDKCFGGGFTAEDAVHGPLTTEAQVAYACGLRELEGEAGITEKQLSLYEQVGGPLTRYVPDRLTGERIKLSRYIFLAVANEGVVLPAHTREESEMSNRRFIPVVNVLRLALLPRGHTEKFNPFHAQALSDTLLVLRARAFASRHPAFDQFLSHLSALKQIGFDINWYSSRIDEEIRRRRI